MLVHVQERCDQCGVKGAKAVQDSSTVDPPAAPTAPVTHHAAAQEPHTDIIGTTHTHITGTSQHISQLEHTHTFQVPPTNTHTYHGDYTHI